MIVAKKPAADKPTVVVPTVAAETPTLPKTEFGKVVKNPTLTL